MLEVVPLAATSPTRLFRISRNILQHNLGMTWQTLANCLDPSPTYRACSFLPPPKLQNSLSGLPVNICLLVIIEMRRNIYPLVILGTLQILTADRVASKKNKINTLDNNITYSLWV
jgi:hypothetical protein